MTSGEGKTVDLFSDESAHNPGSVACSIEIAHTMSDALDKCRVAGVDRTKVAERMSWLLGDQEVSVAMLNAYTAASRTTHQINVERAIAFDSAVHGAIGKRPLLHLQASHAKEHLVSQDEFALIELGRIYLQQRELSERRRALQVILKGKT